LVVERVDAFAEGYDAVFADTVDSDDTVLGLQAHRYVEREIRVQVAMLGARR